MQVLVTIIAPVYWSLSHTSGEVQSGFLLTQGTFRQESQLEFATGEGCHGPRRVGGCGAWSCLAQPLSPPGTQPITGLSFTAGDGAVFGGAVGYYSLSPVPVPSPPRQGSSCGSPTSPGVRMLLVLCSWTV